MGTTDRRYLLRVWLEDRGEGDDHGAWRASLKDVHDGSQRTFSAPEALLTYLRRPDHLAATTDAD